MIKNYFLTAWRHIIRNKAFTLINILGLSVGISAALVIYLIVSFQYSFDKFEPQHDRIYRVVSDMSMGGTAMRNGGVQTSLADVVRREVSGVRTICQLLTEIGQANTTIPNPDHKPALRLKKQDGIIFADPSYLKLISYSWLAGSAAQALNSPNRVVITETQAKLYFPSLKPLDIVGRRIIYNDSIFTTVTGVVKDLPANTEFNFHDLISLSTVSTTALREQYGWGDWQSTTSNSQLFLVLNPHTAVPDIERQLKEIAKKYIPKPKDINETFKTTFRLQPLHNIHFNPEYGNLNGQQASEPVLFGLVVVTIIILVLACINFINLSTAQSSKRVREIGIRKTLGVTGRQLLTQLLGEPFLLTVFSTLLSLVLTPLLLQVFKDFIPAGLDIKALLEPQLSLFVLTLIVTITFLAGFYPSMILSKYDPVRALKNQASSNRTDTRAWSRKTLAIAQFTTAQVFILFTLIVVKQIRYSINQNPGFRKSAIITVRTPWFDKTPNNRLVFLTALRELPGIELVSLSNAPAASQSYNLNEVSYKDATHPYHSSVQIKYGDTNYLKLFQIPIIAGRTVRALSDTLNEAVINETLAHLLGFRYAKDAINKSLLLHTRKIPIVGVMGDFHQQSMHAKIQPLIFGYSKPSCFTANIALRRQHEGGQQWKTTIKEIGLRFNKLYPDQEFEYEFLDQSIKKFYDADTKISALLTWATGIAISISCLGLLGLVLFTTTSRTKEVGIRKILGASVTQIMTLLTRDFLTPVFLAFLIALPIALWVSSKWLQSFAYRTTIDWWVFVLSFGAMIVVALFTLSFQTIRAATANPVDSLRIE